MFTELYVVSTTLKKGAFVEASKSIIMRICKLKFICKYQLWTFDLYVFEEYDFFVLDFEVGET